MTVVARDAQGREKPVEGKVTRTQGHMKGVIVGSGEAPSPGAEVKVVRVRKCHSFVRLSGEINGV